jgi:uncharacterized protein YbbC (DUF1343 family)
LTADSLKLQHAINLHWLIHAYVTMNKGKSFFTDYINLLAGTDSLRDQVVAGFTEKQIRESWQSRLNEFRKKRKAYLLYRDFSGQ